MDSERSSREEPPLREHNGLYVLSLSLHGLVRGQDIELGADADTGGQVTYVVEQARAVAEHPSVAKVELLTRQILSSTVDSSYAREREPLGERADLVRLPFGPRRYLRKEKLWPYLDELVDRVLRYLRGVGRTPDLVIGHYADAGYVGGQLARVLGVPFVFTGHSLGRVKRQRLLDRGSDEASIEKQYNMSRRIEAEEFALETASLVITSTAQEVEEQYALYDHYVPERMEVDAPGVDLSRFRPPAEDDAPPAIASEIERFLRPGDRPPVLALARPDERKNLVALVEAFGADPWLREHADLVVLAGTRDDIARLGGQPRRVLTDLLIAIDRHDLYGRAAYPKTHASTDVPELYRWAAARRGVFVNPALTEPFGLTLIEAAASGLPLVATNDGGPRDIVGTCENGILVDPLDRDAIASAIRSILQDRDLWEQYSRNGIERAHANYGWERHAETLVLEARRVILGVRARSATTDAAPSRMTHIDRLIVVELDGVLEPDAEALAALVDRLGRASENVGIGYVTGRRPDRARDLVRSIGAPEPDFMICSAGAEIVYGSALHADPAWTRHVDDRWLPREIHHALHDFEGLSPQPQQDQRRFKLSWFRDPEQGPKLEQLRRALRRRKLSAKCILSHDVYLDVIPARASPGRALQFLGFKWELWADRMLVVAASGLGEDMLTGDTLGVVVDGHTGELAGQRDRPRVHFSARPHAWGVIDGIDHYDFLGEIRVPETASSLAAVAQEGERP
jgi:sucrose-phosphate synthase